jgi:hypothetical protein
MTDQARVFLACPRYGPVVFEAAQAAFQASQDHAVMLWANEDSRLPYSFNKLWCAALNTRKEHGWTHFAMLHSDVAPERLWLDTLIAEQQWVGVQVLAAVIPIKDERGLTSTGLYNTTTLAMRRLTLREVHKLPFTFRASDIESPDHALLINTGCWVCDFTQPWVEHIRFGFTERIERQEDGTFEATTMSEDWDFSLQLYDQGVSVAATRRIPLSHYGSKAYGTAEVWGTWLHDQGGR